MTAARAPTPTCRVKGISLKNGVRSLTEVSDASTTEKVFEAMPKELADGLRYGGIVASSWYPVETQATFLRTAAEVTRGGLPLARRMGLVSIAHDLKGPYRAFARLFGPTRVLGVSTRFFNQYYDTAVATLEENRSGHAVLRVDGCHGFGAHVFANIVGATEGILTALGAKNVRVHATGGGGEHDDWIRIEGHWS